MKSLFESETHQNVINRIEKLNENSKPNWGKMNVGQMLKHCQIPMEIALGKREMKTKVGFFKKMIFKLFKPMMYSDKLWKPNVRTPKEFIITESQGFDTEKNKIVNLINEFTANKDNSNWPEHPVFGVFTNEQRGKMQYKHFDHHLRQFGV